MTFLYGINTSNDEDHALEGGKFLFSCLCLRVPYLAPTRWPGFFFFLKDQGVYVVVFVFYMRDIGNCVLFPIL